MNPHTELTACEETISIVVPNLYANAIERSDVWIAKARELAHLKASIKQLEARELLISQQLKDLSQGVDSKGGGYVFSCSFRKGSVQYKNIPQLKGVNLEQFRGREIETWKLTMDDNWKLTMDDKMNKLFTKKLDQKEIKTFDKDGNLTPEANFLVNATPSQMYKQAMKELNDLLKD
jgi:lipopolysaccharide export LptBFGC system permease protein LptF